MSQKISFMQPDKYTQNSPEERILNLEFQNFSRGKSPQTPTQNCPFGAQLLPPVQNSSSPVQNFFLLYTTIVFFPDAPSPCG